MVCHNDLSPCNFVFSAGRPLAIIDFDSASPVPRMHDLGYAAWMWLDLGDDDIEPDLQRRRLTLFCKAYDTEWIFRVSSILFYCDSGFCLRRGDALVMWLWNAGRPIATNGPSGTSTICSTHRTPIAGPQTPETSSRGEYPRTGLFHQF
ncbi:phosphotransferase [Rhizobium viscosum]|uniref:phosphotransferase n=1 Tax=Rhizobium viscosum TaxID=1673 RepID=UPI001AEEE5C6